MSSRPDLVIRGGTVIDGTGSPPVEADVAIEGDRIVEIGRIQAAGVEELDARGKIVTPGFVDIHTHYDGQVVWSSNLSPSSLHGVTTTVMGNCGVGFAPCRPPDRERLIELMQGVEDIPEPVMAEGLTWEWETFPEYLDLIESRHYDVDIGEQLPHAALRLYVMGSRAVAREPSTSEDNVRMAQLTREAMRAGALGFGTSRTLHHLSGSGKTISTYGASEAELTAIGQAMSGVGHGVMELVFDLADVDREFQVFRNVARATGRPMSYGLAQLAEDPQSWRKAMKYSAEAQSEGLSIKPQVTPRGIGMLMGHELSGHPFAFCATYRELEKLPFERKLAELRKPEVRKQLLGEQLGAPANPAHERYRNRLRDFAYMFPLGDPPNYEPSPDSSIAQLAKRLGRDALEVAYDLMLEQDGKAMLYYPSGNYAEFTLDTVLEMLNDSNSVLGLGDGGAHCGTICDASYPTFMLQYWTRERPGKRLSLPFVIKSLTSATASVFGLNDRGRIAPGFKADVNVIDYDQVRLHAPRVVRDMPGGGRRIIQDASGFEATILSGTVTYARGQPTGKLPGKLIRGPQRAPQRPAA